MAPRPSLTTLDTIALIVGLVVGVGIFRAPQLVAQNTGSEALFIAAWVAGGVVSLLGALCYAELATSHPHAGGEYHFLRRAFGRDVSFLFAWSRATVIQTGSLAILAYVFADYAAPLLPGPLSQPVLAAAAVVALTAVNAAGLRYGRTMQNGLTMVQVLGLLAVIVAGLLLIPGGEAAVPRELPAAGANAGIGGGAALGLAMVFVLLTFGGWNEAAYVSAELLDGPRGMTRALLGGIGLITLLYVLANLAYLQALGFAGVADSSVVAADVLRIVAGDAGAVVLSVIVAVSALCSANATVITGGRGNYALGRDFGLFGFLGEWRQQGQTPVNALLAQGGIALVLIAFGAVARSGFEAMVAFTAPVFWLFLALVGLAVPVLRKREPGIARPFRVPLYPLTPLLFAAASVFMLYSSVRYAGNGALLGVAVMVAGIPVLLVSRPHPVEVSRAGESA